VEKEPLKDGILITVRIFPCSVTVARESPKFLVAVRIRAGKPYKSPGLGDRVKGEQ
jgi:hypothetical protein